MNKILAALLVTVLGTTTASLCVVAYADDAASEPAPAHVSKRQADKQADAQYKSDVKTAEARHATAKAGCGSSLTATGRSCKDDVGAQERKDKADAKLKQVDTKSGN